MKYLELLWALDVIYRYHPQYHGSQLLIMADDVLKWFRGDLPADSSALRYLEASFATPAEALGRVWDEIQLLAGPLVQQN